jgi:hypothetical protein
MTHSKARIGRWMLGGAVFVAAATVYFEAVGQSSPRPPRAIANDYRAVSIEDPDVRAAVDFALMDQQRKNRSAAKLLSIVSAERQLSGGENFRMCVSLDRRGRTETARVVVRRNPKRQLSVTLWAWDGCGKKLPVTSTQITAPPPASPVRE